MNMYNFDKNIDRRHSNCYKWDVTDDSEVIPMWVADMDFQVAPAIIDTLRKRVEHGVPREWGGRPHGAGRRRWRAGGRG